MGECLAILLSALSGHWLALYKCSLLLCLLLYYSITIYHLPRRDQSLRQWAERMEESDAVEEGEESCCTCTSNWTPPLVCLNGINGSSCNVLELSSHSKGEGHGLHLDVR